MRASHWQEYASGEEIVKEGEMDDRFYIIVSGNCAMERHGERIGLLSSGECFGETSYVQGAKRTATILRGRRRHRAEGQFDAARAGVGILPAALQPGIPALADRPAADQRGASLALKA